MRSFQYTSGKYQFAIYGCISIFAAIVLFILGIFTGHVARPKSALESLPLIFILVFPLVALFFIWWPARPVATNNEGISKLVFGVSMAFIEWDKINEIDLIRYKDQKSRKNREIIVIYSSSSRINIYDMIDSYSIIKGIIGEKTKNTPASRFEIDRSKGSIKIPNVSILNA